jgi:hypothetical protein
MNNTNLAAQSLIGGGEGNTIQKYASHSAILAGAQNSIGRAATNQSASPLLKALASIGQVLITASLAGGKLNGIGDYADYCSIVGGYDSDIGDYATYAFIGGGGFNSIASYAVVSTIGGGFGNSIGNDAWNSTVAGGIQNAIGDSSRGSSIGGGAENEIDMSASNSTIAGGLQNQIRDSTVGGTIGGGVSNKVDQAAIFSTVSGGYSNVVGRPASVIGGGQYNFIAGRIATIWRLAWPTRFSTKPRAPSLGGGASNIVENAVTNGTIAGGLGNTIHSNANFSAIGGGRENHIASTAPCAAIPGGREGRAISYGQIAHASGGFAGNQGTAQESFYVLRGTTVDNAQTELFLDGTGERVHVPASSTWTYDVLVTARDSGATPAGFHIRGMMGYNAAGILVAFGAPIITQLAGAPAITAQVLPDNVNKALTVKVTWGLANPLVARWVATVRTAEVAFPQ